MRINGASIRGAAVDLCLLLVACVVGLALCEVSLRLFYPKYRHVAEHQFHREAMRIRARTPNSRDWTNHPDTRVTHSFHHNNLALRQHRDFSEADLAAATNIGVFGDSYVENVRMPVQYSFTEPLDYLLNQRGRRFNVLNFGVESYGPGQSLLHYEHFPFATDLDHVLYVYCQNDLGNIYATGLFHLDEAGHLVRNEEIRESWWTPLIRRLHIAYLILDVSDRLSSFLAETAGDTENLWGGEVATGRETSYSQKNSLAIFRQMIRYWKHLAEHNGSTFSVVLLPRRPPQPFTVDLLYAEGVEVIDLYNCFETHDPAHSDPHWYYSPYRFRKDDHWNEAGNRLASVCLYRVLEEKTGLPRLSEGRLQETLSRYYAAFEKETILKARGGHEGAGSLKTSADIREKYTAFDMNTSLKKFKEEILESAPQPNKPIIASDFDVFLVQNRLIYIKEHCSPADMKARFFLHVIPVDRRDLYEDHRKRGFQIMRPSFWRVFRVGRHGCAARIKLPRYPVRYIQTGQYGRSEGRRLWEGAAWIDPHSVGEERPEFPAAAGKRIIRSDFDVYLDDRQLVYHKTVCDPTDREPSFFLHVVPTDETVLPPDRVQYEFENLDFNSCTIERNLPAYTIRHIRTGQYTDEGQLWGVEFPLEQTSGSRGDERAAALQRTVRSVFDVTLDGRRLIYRKATCRPADREAPFFLHVTPVDATVLLPTRVQWGFESLDFWHRSEFRVDEFGCTIKRRLPGYAIRGIRTGQYIPGKGPLWEGEFAMMQDTLGQD